MVVQPDKRPAQQNGAATGLRSFLEARAERLAEWVKGRIDPASLIRFAVLEYSNSTQLQACTPESIYLALIACAQVGLEPSGVKGEAYIVPFKNTATFMPGYRGLIKLALRSGAVKSLASHVVYESDEFVIDLGSDPRVVHRLALADRGKAIGAYALAKLANGEFEIEWMPMEELEKIRKSAERGGRESPAYSNWAEQMYRKAPIRRLCKRIPMGDDYYLAAALDEKAESGDLDSYRRVLDVHDDSTRGDAAQSPTPAASPARGAAAAKAELAKRQASAAPAPTGETSPPASDPAAAPAPAATKESKARGRRTASPPADSAPAPTASSEQTSLPVGNPPGVPQTKPDPADLREIEQTIAALFDNRQWIPETEERIRRLPDGMDKARLSGLLQDVRGQIAAEEAAAEAAFAEEEGE